MADPRHAKRLELEQLALNLEYSFNRGVDLHNRVIQLTEDIDDHHFCMFDSAMTTLENMNKRTITIKVNSYGGDVYTALGIIGRMLESKCRIHTKGYGKIMSASTAILAAGHKRSMSRLAEFMHHEASYAVEGRHSEIQHEVKQSQSLSDKWCALMSELTGIPKQYWSQKGQGKDFYLSPEKCLDLNIVDEVF
jgi:ATP-dependent Clp protease protease subunit